MHGRKQYLEWFGRTQYVTKNWKIWKKKMIRGWIFLGQRKYLDEDNMCAWRAFQEEEIVLERHYLIEDEFREI